MHSPRWVAIVADAAEVVLLRTSVETSPTHLYMYLHSRISTYSQRVEVDVALLSSSSAVVFYFFFLGETSPQETCQRGDLAQCGIPNSVFVVVVVFGSSTSRSSLTYCTDNVEI